MKYTIKDCPKITFLLKKRETITLNGYAFIDEYGHCFFIVYGEKRRDLLKEYLT